ncbi:recombinase family protein [Polluticoccus soli]|uniref:recombinase family protein n=1 Tax=Polluticoccus soli TaxID=3034150 RepID=UPI0023E24D8F|nr:recombinase family protein [Flavipsychrobacter sp. JY13-12]
MKKAVLYTRVSTDEQKRTGFSLQEQYNRLKDYCTRKGYQIVGHYQDDHSAKNFKRPEYQRFLEDVRLKRVRPDLLLVTKADRFTRDAFEGYTQITNLRKNNIEVESLSDGSYDFTNPNKFFQNLLQFGAAQHENILKADNTKRGMREALRQGRWVWPAPVGYDNDTNTKLVVIDSANAPYVKKAFDLVASGLYSCEEVRRMLNNEGFKRTKQAFMNMLRNPFYYGYILVKEWQNEPEELVKGIHEPIISETVFSKVQLVLKRRKRNWPKTQALNEQLPLRGHLICQDCGKSLTGSGSVSRNKSIHHYYHCQNGCKERFRADNANVCFAEYLKTFEVPTDVVQLYKEVLKDMFQQDDSERKKKLADIDKQMRLVNGRLASLADKLADDKISYEDFNEAKLRYKEELNKMDIEYQELNGIKSSFDRYLTYGLMILPDISKYYTQADLTAKREIVGSIFPEKVIFDGKSYRTSRVNGLFSLFSNTGKGLGGQKNKKAGKNSDLFDLAPPSGLEPETP